MAKFVIDISSHQKGLDISKIKDQIDGIILRIGRTYYDSNVEDDDDCFNEWYNYCISNGVPVGCYYYSCAYNDKEVEDETKLLLALLKGKSMQLGVWYDTENTEKQRPLSTNELTRVSKKWCDTIKTAGYNVGIYASLSWLNNELNMDQLTEYPVWVARYNSTLGYNGKNKLVMWQYTSTGRLNGWSGNLDFNHYYGEIGEVTKDENAVQVNSPIVAKENEFTRQVQRSLNALGFLGRNNKKLSIDGIQGDNTTYAIKKFQAIMGITVDGVFGSVSRGVLDQVMDRPTLKLKAKSNNVYATRFVQSKVGAKVDGKFGTKTDKMVRNFQKRHKLNVDGIVGEKTYSKMIK